MSREVLKLNKKVLPEPAHVNMAVDVLTKNLEKPKEKFLRVNNVVHKERLPTIYKIQEDEETLIEEDTELDAHIESSELALLV